MSFPSLLKLSPDSTLAELDSNFYLITPSLRIALPHPDAVHLVHLLLGDGILLANLDSLAWTCPSCYGVLSLFFFYSLLSLHSSESASRSVRISVLACPPRLLSDSRSSTSIGPFSVRLDWTYHASESFDLHALAPLFASIRLSPVFTHFQSCGLFSVPFSLTFLLDSYCANLCNRRPVKKGISRVNSAEVFNSAPSLRFGSSASCSIVLSLLVQVFRTEFPRPINPYSNYYYRAFPTAGGLASCVPVVLTQHEVFMFDNDTSSFSSIVPPSSLFLSSAFNECRLNWGESQPPACLVVLCSQFARLSPRYHEFALKLSLLDCGVALGQIHALNPSFGLTGCIAGAMQVLELFSEPSLAKYKLIPLSAFGFIANP